MPNGKIQERHSSSLVSIGKWLEKNGQTIYGTREGPVPPGEEMVSTQKGENIYLHVLDEKRKSYLIPGFTGKIESMTFASGQKVKYKVNEFGLAFSIPDQERDSIDTIITMRVRQ
jgi:alpha-L-fucosidase